MPPRTAGRREETRGEEGEDMVRRNEKRENSLNTKRDQDGATRWEMRNTISEHESDRMGNENYNL
jgi:hypothetical protein